MTGQPEPTGEEGPGPREALEKFVLDNEELARLEERTSQFNFFEAVDIVRQETRHSSFLAWLMDPAHTHGLGDAFLKGFLFKTSVAARGLGIETISPIDVDVWDLSGTEVRREWKNIDITLLEKSRRFVCLIENKVHSSEHSDQLRRYREIVEAEFPGYTRHYVLLNVTGEEPSDSDYYVGVTYDEVCDVIERLLKTRASAVGDDVRIALSHYVTMVRRHVMPDNNLQELCRKIYARHRQALDLIFEYRQDLQSELRDALAEIIEAEEAFTLDGASKQYTRFLPISWDTQKLRRGEGWTPSRRMLMLQFINRPNSLTLTAHLGPGDQDVRREVFEVVQTAGAPFRPSTKTLTAKWLQLYDKPFLKPADYDDPDTERLVSRITQLWEEFKAGDLVTIRESLEGVLT